VLTVRADGVLGAAGDCLAGAVAAATGKLGPLVGGLLRPQQNHTAMPTMPMMFSVMLMMNTTMKM
jgi:hypothetical protein